MNYTAFIFYIFQVYKPECDNSKRAKIVLDPLFLDLIKFIEITIACCRKYVSIDENKKLIIDWDNKSDKSIYFIPIQKGINQGHRSAVKKTSKEIVELENAYKEKLKEIKDRVVFKECDSDILDSFSKLEASTFFKSVINPAILLEGTFIKFSNFDKNVDEFEMIKDEFKKICGIECAYDIKAAEKMEIVVSEAIIYKGALQVSSTDEFNEISLREYIKMKLKPVIKDESELNKTIGEILPIAIDKMKDRQ